MSSYAYTTTAQTARRTIHRTVSTAPATEAQLGFLRSLLKDRDFTNEVAAAFADRCENRLRAGELSKHDASLAISWIKDHCPVKAVEASCGDAVPSGHYALQDSDGVIKFYKVDSPKTGKWAGRTFVKVQAGDDLHPVHRSAAPAILRSIAENPAEASARYGHALGRCGVCSRTLTDEESRARGIGPVCARKNGW